MRVLHLTTEYPPVVYGGLGTALGGLTVAQARTGMEVGVLVAGSRAAYGLPAGPFPGSSQITIERRDGLTIFWCDSHEPTELAVRLVRWWKPDVVHLHVFWLAAVAWAIKQETATPLVYHVHSLDKAEYEIGHEASQCLDQWSTQSEIIEAADRVIVLSRSERELLISYVPQVRSRLSIVGNGIDDEVQPLPSRGGKRVLFTGRFVNRKGIHELLDAIPAVVAAVPDAEFVLAGGHRDCSASEMRRCWIGESLLPFAAHIGFTGWLDGRQMSQLYREMDVLVVPSWYEPFGMVILEGMLHGLPIVAADIGGPAEILEHERTGLLVPPRDAAALAGALIRLLTDAQFRRRLASAAAVEVRKKWLWSARISLFVSAYRAAIGE